MIDLAAFWAVLAAFLSKTLGITDAIAAVFKAVRDGGDALQIGLREKLARGLARPMMRLAWLYFAVIALAMGFMIKAAIWHDAIWTSAFWTTLIVTAIAMAAPTWFVRRETGRVLFHKPPSEEPPSDVNYPACAGSLLLGAITISVVLSLFALNLNSNLLWLLSMAVRYLMLGVCTLALMVAAWIVRNTGSLLEKALELFFVVCAPILPGITYENVRERLFPHGLEFIEEEDLAAKIAAITGILAGILLPFDLVVLSLPYYGVAFAFGMGYLVKVLAAGIVIAAGREDLVDASRKRLSGILFTYFPWIAAFTSCASRIVYAYLPAPFESIADWFMRFMHGDTPIVGWHPWYVNAALLLLALVVLLIGVGVAEVVTSRKVKMFAIGIPVLFCLWPVGSLLQNIGVWNGTLGAVSPKTPEQEIVITNGVKGVGDDPALAKVGESYAVLSWFTDKKADCQLEIISVSSSKKDYEHREYVRGTRLQARANEFLHSVTLDGLQDGVTVKYRLHCSIAEGKYRGLTTQTHEYEYAHKSSAQLETAASPSAAPIASSSSPAPPDASGGTKTPESKPPALPVVSAKTERKNRSRRSDAERAEDERLEREADEAVNAL